MIHEHVFNSLHYNNIYTIWRERESGGGGGKQPHHMAKPPVLLSSIYNIIYAMYYSVRMTFP
jgi:hypothetical protein